MKSSEVTSMAKVPCWNGFDAACPADDPRQRGCGPRNGWWSGRSSEQRPAKNPDGENNREGPK